ncbi:hypothetical protein CEQ83_14285 [Priestia megaterium]|uniref:hypothetical protein n=1 Tax=Priestia megaterium TaxID=1404 RepID=UPI0012A9DB16|nr:hypothetical protein [Priestia megaterium]QFY73640.1 hypothetical protein CEQ83_14285 [Priestia megaterium]
MKKKLSFNMNKFANIPVTLQKTGHPSIPVDYITIDVREICHFLYVDAYGSSPPFSRSQHLFEHYKPFITRDEYFRFVRRGLGSHKEVRIGESNRWGKAFCRWFLHEHLGIDYFVHMDEVLDKSILIEGGYKIERSIVAGKSVNGDTPDYICAKSAREIYMAEAKGRKDSISFGNKEFVKWRNQFKRVTIRDSSGLAHSVKGYIVATRLLTKNEYKTVKPNLLAEDPYTPGLEDFRELDNWPEEIGQMIIAGHYANFLEILGMFELGDALRFNYTLPSEIKIPVGVWRSILPSLRNKRFVGMFVPCFSNFTLNYLYPELRHESAVFIGIDLDIFQTVRDATIVGRRILSQIEKFPLNDEHRAANISILRDGTIMTPLQTMEFDELIYM